jgi:hypothetical protein
LDAAPALDTALDMGDPQPTLRELLVRHGLLPREFPLQIEINSMANKKTCPRRRRARAEENPTFKVEY